jgi:hypothetical protein
MFIPGTKRNYKSLSVTNEKYIKNIKIQPPLSFCSSHAFPATPTPPPDSSQQVRGIFSTDKSLISAVVPVFLSIPH